MDNTNYKKLYDDLRDMENKIWKDIKLERQKILKEKEQLDIEKKEIEEKKNTIFFEKLKSIFQL